MKRVLFLLAVTGCGFEVAGGSSAVADGPTPGSDGATPGSEATLPLGDAMVDAAPAPDASPPIDAAPPHVCAGYVAVAAAGTLSTYKRFNGGDAWPTAKARCEQDTAYLVIPETTVEAKAVYNFIAPDFDSPYYWAGLTRSGNGVIDLLNRTTANPPWGPAQPNHGATDPILVDEDGAYYDYPAGAPQEYACECAPN